MSDQDLRPPASTRFGGFVEGFGAPLDGLRYMVRYPALWRFGLLPMALNLVITLVVLVGLIVAAVGLAAYLHPKFPEGTWGIVWEVLAVLAMLLLAVGLAAATWMLLNGILSGFFYGKLAEAVERQLGLPPDEISEIPFRYQVADTLRDVAAMVLVNTGLLMLNCVPLIGSVAAICGAFYFNGYILGRDFLDFPLALRGMRRKEKHAFCRRNRWHTLGLGTVVLLLGLVPLLGALVLTTATTGAVLLHRRLAGNKTPLSPAAEPPELGE